MLQNNIALAFGSDAPIESLNPFLGIHSAVYRMSALDGKVFRREETIDPLQAITAYSLGAAKASCSETERGSLEVGKLADLIVIEDFRKQHADFWLNAESCLTMLNGEILKA
jgi:predicted amidohydrolase YtcJ